MLTATRHACPGFVSLLVLFTAVVSSTNNTHRAFCIHHDTHEHSPTRSHSKSAFENKQTKSVPALKTFLVFFSNTAELLCPQQWFPREECRGINISRYPPPRAPLPVGNAEGRHQTLDQTQPLAKRSSTKQAESHPCLAVASPRDKKEASTNSRPNRTEYSLFTASLSTHRGRLPRRLLPSPGRRESPPRAAPAAAKGAEHRPSRLRPNHTTRLLTRWRSCHRRTVAPSRR